MEAFLIGLIAALEPQVLLLTLIGVVVGLVMSAMPGLTTTVAVVLLLPFTFYMEAAPSMGLLIGVFVGGMAGGAVSAILINIPGNPSSVITNVDGYPMTKQGKASEALSLAFLASFLGGVIGLALLVLIAPQLARTALLFGAPEQFALVLLGLTLVAGFSEGNLSRGFISAGIGLMIATVGMDSIAGTPRFTFGAVTLQQGISFIPIMIGMFALPLAVDALRERAAQSLPPLVVPAYQPITTFLAAARQLPRTLVCIVRSSVIGTIIGAIPGTGSTIAAIVAYQTAKKFPRVKDIPFGKGNPEGIAAPESANSAMMGGALIPMMILGIPGDPVTAVMLGALTVVGVNPGPLMLQQHPEVVYGIFGSFAVALVFLLAVAIMGIPLFVRAIAIPVRILMPTIVLLCVIGSYALRNSLLDIWVMLAAGVLAYFMKRWGYPILPMLLAIILGPILETQFRMSLIISFGDPMIFLKEPISLTLIITAAIFVAVLIRSELRARSPQQTDQASSPDGCPPLTLNSKGTSE